MTLSTALVSVEIMVVGLPLLACCFSGIRAALAVLCLLSSSTYISPMSGARKTLSRPVHSRGAHQDTFPAFRSRLRSRTQIDNWVVRQESCSRPTQLRFRMLLAGCFE